MDLSNFAPYLSVVEIILAVVVIVLVLLQSKGSDLGGFMGGESGGTHTRRGVEAGLHRVTIYFFIAFFVVTVLTFIAVGQAG
jgi:preprotein translocase subunit SecG